MCPSEAINALGVKRQIYLFATSQHPDAISVKSLAVRFVKPAIDFSKYDYLIITSKQTIKALEQYEKKDFINIPALCVSEKTATSYKNFGGKILDIGDGYGDHLIKNLKEKSKEKRWLYLRAKVIASNFVNRSKDDGFYIDEKVVYVSECASEVLEVEITKNPVLIFTSPSSIKCYLKTHRIAKGTPVVVIGKTTALSLPKDVNFYISAKTSIDSCIEMAKSLQV